MKSTKEARTVPFCSADNIAFYPTIVPSPCCYKPIRCRVAPYCCPWSVLPCEGARASSFIHCCAINPNPTTPLSFVSPGIHLSAPNIKDGVITAAKQTRLPDRGYPMSQIGTHSLRASGAMALKLNGYHQTEIMKLVRWTSTTFLTYIHSQIAALSAGIATQMTRRIEFFNVEGSTA
eukprot:scaffold22746_cov52-Attheya_sp.AAC.3